MKILAIVLSIACVCSCAYGEGIGGGVGGGNGAGSGVGDPDGIAATKIALAPTTPCTLNLSSDYSDSTGCHMVGLEEGMR